MCGITGHISIKQPVSNDNFASMVNTLAHRGPDDSGVYISHDGSVALGHRRLSFIDLSGAGKQPLSNKEETIWITFNGEIYNYIELKNELSSTYHFNTDTDTEVIIAAYEKWGIDCINRLKGMFSFGLYDKEKARLFLVRDRFGIKPLYYFKLGSHFIFASEIKAILKSGIVKEEIDFTSFTDFFVYRYIPSPKTIWKNISKIPPAHYLEIDVKSLAVTEYEYWQLSSGENSVNQQQFVNETGMLLQHSVKEHIRADVPVGSFLSGGYDSSAMVYYMKSLNKKPDTFSIGFSKWEKSEHHFAKLVADHLNVNNEAVIADESSLELIEKMPVVYDEPIADISIIPTYMVSNLARKKVKAVLSGEGADEIFAGYTWQYEFYKKSYPAGLLDKIRNILNPGDTVSFYANAMAMGWFDKEELKQMLQPHLHQYIADDVHWFYRKHYHKHLSPLKSIQYMDMKCFMGELVLTKIDRASMANSLEVRVPFLDHEIFERVFSVKEQCYYTKDQTKYLLYKNLEHHLPDEILQRKKQGFVGPDSYYMNLDFYKKHLADSILVKHGIINQTYIDKLLKETYNWKLWKILVMEKWFAHWVGA